MRPTPYLEAGRSRSGRLRVLLVDGAEAVAEAAARLDRALGPRRGELTLLTSFAGIDGAVGGGRPPDLVLFEPQARDCGNLAELDRLRTRIGGSTRFAAFTRHDSAFDARRLLRAGLHGYLPKRTEPPVLRAAIELILAGGIYLPPTLLGGALDDEGDGGATANGDGHGARPAAAVAGGGPALRGAVFRRVLHPDGRMTYAYIRVIEPDATGLDEGALQEKGPEALLAAMHPADRPLWWASLRASARDLSPHAVDFRLAGKDGRYRWFRAVSRPFRGEGGTVVWDGYCGEIAPERRDPAAQSREDRLRGLLDRTFQFIGLLSPEGTLLEINQTALDFGGLGYTEVVGKPFWEARWWDLSKRHREELRAAIGRAAQGEFVRYEADLLSRDDRVVTADFSIKPVTDDGGRVTFLIAEGRDVSSLFTDRPVAELEGQLRDGGQRLGAILANLPGVVFRGTVGPDGRPSFLFVSRGVRDLTGVPAEAAVADAAALFDRIHPDDRPAHLAAVREAHRTLRPINRVVRFITPAGRLRWLRIAAQPWRAPGGEVVSDGVAVDITEQHEAKERLRENERSFAAIAANLPGVVFRGVVPPDGGEPGFTYVSPNVTRFAGITPEEAIADPERLLATIHPDDREHHRRAVRGRIANPEAPDHEFRVVRPDGTVRWLRSVATTWRRPNGELVIDGIALDITEQRETEERLRERERVLGALTDNLPAVILRCVHGRDGSSRCAFVAGALERLTGLSVEGVLSRATPLSSRIHPDDRAACLAAYDRAAADLTELDHEYRFVRPDGEVRWLRWIGRPAPVPGGGDVVIDGVLLDVTEHRQALDELDRRNRDLLSLCRISEIALRSPDLDAGLRGIVDELGRLTGFDTASVDLYDEDRQLIDLRAFKRFDTGCFEPGLVAPIRKTLAGEVVRTGRIVIERRCLERDEPHLTLIRQLGHQTFFGVPIRVGERVIGCFGLTAAADVEINPQLIELASSWADYIASFIASQGARDIPAVLGPAARHSEAFEAAFASLTPRQRDVLAELARGSSNKDIAAALGLQEATVKIHVRAILKALGATNRTQAAMIANRVEATQSARRRPPKEP